MGKLIIDERDLRCTILQGMRDVLGTSDLDHKVEGVIQQVLACGDPVSPDPMEGICPICENGTLSEQTAEAWRWSCGHWIKPRPEPVDAVGKPIIEGQPYVQLVVPSPLEIVEGTYQSDEKCLDCGAEGPHHCPGVPGGFGDDP